MSLLVPDVGEVLLLGRMLYGSSPENLTLKLYKTNVTPAESDTHASYTEADFTGYAATTLTSTQSGGTWAVPTTSSGTTSSTYGTNSVFSCTGGSSQTVYGYYVVGATSGTLHWAELFSSSRNMTPPSDTLTVTPKIELA